MFSLEYYIVEKVKEKNQSLFIHYVLINYLCVFAVTVTCSALALIITWLSRIDSDWSVTRSSNQLFTVSMATLYIRPLFRVTESGAAFMSSITLQTRSCLFHTNAAVTIVHLNYQIVVKMD